MNHKLTKNEWIPEILLMYERDGDNNRTIKSEVNIITSVPKEGLNIMHSPRQNVSTG